MKSYKTLIFIIVVIVLLAAVCLLFPSDGVPFLGRRLFFPTLKEVLSPEKSVSVDEKMRALEESIKMQAITDSINTARETARQDSIRFYKKFFTTHSARFYLPADDYSFFDTLFEAMEQCKTDSSIVSPLHGSHPALPIACDAFNARTVAVREYHYIFCALMACKVLRLLCGRIFFRSASV